LLLLTSGVVARCPRMRGRRGRHASEQGAACRRPCTRGGAWGRACACCAGSRPCRARQRARPRAAGGSGAGTRARACASAAGGWRCPRRCSASPTAAPQSRALRRAPRARPLGARLPARLTTCGACRPRRAANAGGARLALHRAWRLVPHCDIAHSAPGAVQGARAPPGRCAAAARARCRAAGQARLRCPSPTAGAPAQ